MPTIVEKYVSIVERQTLETKAVIYGISGLGLLYAMYVVRPFAKFRRPSDVPKHFFRDHIPFRGTIAYVDMNNDNTLLMIDHKPLLPLPRWGKHKYLPVKLPGVNVTSNGISWLQVCAVGKNALLIPVSRERQFVECIVTVLWDNEKPLNIASELTRLGIGTVTDEKSESIKESHVRSYLKSLAKAQKSAEKNRNGYWHFNKDRTFAWRIGMYMRKKVNSIVSMLKITRPKMGRAAGKYVL